LETARADKNYAAITFVHKNMFFTPAACYASSALPLPCLDELYAIWKSAYEFTLNGAYSRHLAITINRGDSRDRR
jgi:hypothetical protein